MLRGNMRHTRLFSDACSTVRSSKNQRALPASVTFSLSSKSSTMKLSSRLASTKASYICQAIFCEDPARATHQRTKIVELTMSDNKVLSGQKPHLIVGYFPNVTHILREIAIDHQTTIWWKHVLGKSRNRTNTLIYIGRTLNSTRFVQGAVGAFTNTEPKFYVTKTKKSDTNESQNMNPKK